MRRRTLFNIFHTQLPSINFSSGNLNSIVYQSCGRITTRITHKTISFQIWALLFFIQNYFCIRLELKFWGKYHLFRSLMTSQIPSGCEWKNTIANLEIVYSRTTIFFNINEAYKLFLTYAKSLPANTNLLCFLGSYCYWNTILQNYMQISRYLNLLVSFLKRNNKIIFFKWFIPSELFQNWFSFSSIQEFLMEFGITKNEDSNYQA